MAESVRKRSKPVERPQKARTTAPRFDGLVASSPRSSAAARGSSRKRNTHCELVLRRALWKRGLRYRVDVATLPGRPDIVFPGARVVVFCDGDFWHGRDLIQRLTKLEKGHNAPYWVRKIWTNFERDRQHDRALVEVGWLVVRLWESVILRDPEAAAELIEREVKGKM